MSKIQVKLLEVQNLSKSFRIGKIRAQALFNINFDLFEKETLGLVGESGCGKSLIARTILSLEKKDTGRVLFKGYDLDKLSPYALKRTRQHMQIIFQDPYASLNPKMTVRAIIGEPLDIHEIARGKAREERIEQLLHQVGLDPSYKSRFPHEFSGGQRQRIGIARALALNPELIICDEPLSALDISIQAQVVNLLKKLQKESGLTYLFISHDLSMVKYISTRICVMYLGHILEMGTSESVYTKPLHPYTQALLSSIPLADPVMERMRTKIVLPGEVPSILNPPTGCPFHPRCPKVMEICRHKKPKMREVDPGHYALCHLFGDDSG